MRDTTMSLQRLRATTYWSLVAVTVFHALSAVGGGIGMIVADGLSMPKSLLADTPFTTFTIPVGRRPLGTSADRRGLGDVEAGSDSAAPTGEPRHPIRHRRH
ncbi:MAG TPA: hypothetical protein VIT65_03770 [Microlunatus sp.]